MSVGAALARKATIDELVGAFQVAEGRIRAAYAALVETERELNASFAVVEGSDRRWMRITTGCHHCPRFDEPEQAIAALAKAAWWSIVERLELRAMLSVRRWDELQKRIDDAGRYRAQPLPPITRESVADFVAFYLEHGEDMLAEAVNEVFDFLRPRDWTSDGKLSTNRHDGAVPRKVILGGLVEVGFRETRLRARYGQASQQLLALERVFQSLDGRGDISKTYQSALESAIEAAPIGARVETEYFAARGYRNGRLHIEFLRPDLLAKLNKIAAGRNLRRPDASPTPS